jgi:hypothetical protein
LPAPVLGRYVKGMNYFLSECINSYPFINIWFSIFGPPALSAKCIVVAAIAAAQSAYFLVCFGWVTSIDECGSWVLIVFSCKMCRLWLKEYWQKLKMQ